MSRNVLSALVVTHLLMMPFVVHGKVATLSRLVRALRALEGRRFASALHHLMATHRALPAVTLAAETTAEFTLLLVRHARHVDDAEVVRLRQHLERIREHDLAGGSSATAVVVVVVAVADAGVAVGDTPVRHGNVGARHHRRRGRAMTFLRRRRELLLLLLLVGAVGA